MKKTLLLLVLIAVAVLAYFLWKQNAVTTTTTATTTIEEKTVVEQPIAVEEVVETVKIEGFTAKLSALLAKKFPLEESGLMVVKLTNPQVKFDAASNQLMILMDGAVSRPNSSAWQRGPVTTKADLNYDANSKALVLNNVKLTSFNLNSPEAQLSEKAGSIVSVLMDKALNNLQIISNQENSQLEKLAPDSLKNYKITDDGTLIIPVKK